MRTLLDNQVAIAQEMREEQTSLLEPTSVQEMLNARQEYQVVKFRTTCSDCVPCL